MAQKVNRVVTFYSYKGGVGRSMAVANIGLLLAKWNYKVLLIDWDLEAPGLENYFKSLLDLDKAKIKLGLIDLLRLKTESPLAAVEEIPWKDYINMIEVNNVTNLHLITAGRRDENYIKNVREFDYIRFYERFDGGEYLENLREFWLDNYDFVFIDSRTGLTDSSGICSIHMPDILMLFFTPNEQSFYGIKDVSRKAIEGQKEIIYDRFQLRTLPIPCKIENAETVLLDEWMKKISVESVDMFEWLPKNKDMEHVISPAQIINQIKIPYKTLYSFGENLAIDELKINDPSEVSYVYQTIAALIANDLQDSHLLIDSRDTLIKKVKGEEIVDTASLIQQVRNEKKYKEEIENLLKDKLDNEAQLKTYYSKRRSRGIAYSIFGGIAIALVILLLIFFLKPAGNSLGSIKNTDDSLSQSKATAFVTQYSDPSAEKYDVPFNLRMLKEYYLLDKRYQDTLQNIKGQIENTIGYKFRDILDSFYRGIRINSNNIQEYLADSIEWSGKKTSRQDFQGWFNKFSNYTFLNKIIDSTFSLASDSAGFMAVYLETGNVIIDSELKEYKSFKSLDTVRFDYDIKMNSFTYRIIDSVPVKPTIEIFVCNTKNTQVYRSVGNIANALKSDSGFNVRIRNNFVSSTDPSSPYYITSNQVRYNGKAELKIAQYIQRLINKDPDMNVRLVNARTATRNYISVFICEGNDAPMTQKPAAAK